MLGNILVVGGAGYIGSTMVRTLLAQGYTPVVFDNLSTGHQDFIPEEVTFVKGDLKNFFDICTVFKNKKIEAVMHFAASSLVPESVENPLKYYDNNVLACINLLKAMIENKVNKFIFSSTAAVYGEPRRVPIKEDDLKNPTNPYGHSKIIIEKILEDISNSYDFAYIALRYFNAAGAHSEGGIGEKHDPETHLIPNILKVLTGEKEEITVFGDDYATPDGTCLRDYIHVDDLCSAHLLALNKLIATEKSEVFNLGSGDGYSVKQVIEMAERVTGQKVNLKIGKRRPGDPEKLVASSEKAQRVLGWQAKLTLEDIVSSAWNWEKKQNK